MDKLSTIKERWFEKQMLMLEDRGLNKTQIANKFGYLKGARNGAPFLNFSL